MIIAIVRKNNAVKLKFLLIDFATPQIFVLCVLIVQLIVYVCQCVCVT